MSTRTEPSQFERPTKRGPAGVTAIALQGVTALGALAGVQGFLSGAFDPLVAELHEAWPLVDGPVLPALALGALVGLPHVGALVLGLRRDDRAPVVGVGVGAVLLGWVTVQLPLIGWSSPIQWLFLGVGIAEIAAAGTWWSRERRHR